ncbi:glutamate decarboxylase [Carnobacterium maltaromaticum]|uniref:Glutamate decarboxylase n=1 Tax=Carnobacterium maltaromaticum TaxID=2751 RepID=A0AAW9K1S3_CARML|nr:glutamate decarboxylase [Carnobacterium maltaromaticum]KRN84668.1 gadB protein [Carnobacterium maltaromaticum]MDT1945897.1 glutamate decarboxylase [Carnobacterium maltaromaticum]MDT2000401.1 glutamate decarboxylase [Carnobacterium maltaromaticum]MDZ5757382.1 glutamate decarboxylase [Carnobacterium maltaromaticum]TFJ30285.1 glutamate decarboxylase [Carnobacterium maltaromaticum]
MLYGKEDQTKKNDYLEPIFGTGAEEQEIPKYKLGKNPIEPRVAYRLVKDEFLDEGNARQNLATFCQTYMEDEAALLMAETLEKNAIDKSEYPRTAELENRCVNILADLWNAPKEKSYTGTSTVGSSEACMLAGMAMKFRWRNQAKKLGLNIQAASPNLVISSGYQVCWEKFCVYWDIEMRTVPMDEKHMSMDMDKVMDYVDEYTIGIVGILGITYTGKYDDIKALDALVETYNSQTDYKISIHVDGASGAMFAPFIEPELQWDFRLKNVASINTSGHKYGLVYPGIGWVLWRDKAYLPEELVFNVSYLGGKMPTMAINFSRSASQIIGQYYNFLRFGFEGYRAIHQRTKDVAMYLAAEVEKTGLFKMYNDGVNLPIVCYALKVETEVEWTLYDLADRLLMKGWQVPAYPLPADLEDVLVQRYVVRADFGMNTAVDFMEDFNEALKELNQAHVLFHSKEEHGAQGFTH